MQNICRQEEKRILDRILAQEVYDTRMRPLGINSTDGPTIVRVNLYVRSFEKIDDVKMVRIKLVLATAKPNSLNFSSEEK